MKFFFADVPQNLRRNFTWFYWDIGVWGFYTGSTVVFLNVYAVRAGASSEQIGWLGAGPAIVALLCSIPLGLLARHISPKRSVVISAFLARASLLIYVLIPTVIPPDGRVLALLLVTALMAIPNTLLGICFGPFFMRGVPGEWRGNVVGGRNAIGSIISFFITLICGQLLVHIPFPLGYQIVFFIGFLGAIATVYVLIHVEQFVDTLPSHAHDAMPTESTKRGSLQALLPKDDPAGRHYITVVLMLFGLNASAYMVAPLIPQFTVHQLGLDDAAISVGSALGSMLVFAVSLFVGRMASRYGNKNLTAAGVAFLCLQTVVLAQAHDASLFIISSVIGGFASGILSAAQFNYHLENVPRKDQTAWISWNTLLGNVAALIGSIAGPALGGIIGIPGAMVALGLLRLMLGATIYLWG